MNEPIVIKTVLELDENGKRKFKSEVERSLNSPDVQAKAKQAGLKAGEAYSLGVKTGRNQQAAEQRELQHIRRLESIHLQSGARLQQIEARRLAQIDVIRERALQQEQSRLRRLESQAQASARNIANAFRAVGGLLPGLGVAAFGATAIDQAFAANRLETQLTSMLGSLAKAQAKILEFRTIAKETPGVLASGLIEAFTQLRQIAGLTEATATRFALAANRIKALFPAVESVGALSLNLQQIFSQNFELQDVKQLFGVAPGLFQAIQQRLGAANLETLREMKKQGKLTAESYAGAFIDELTARSGSISETLQLRIAKALEDTNIKIAALGDKLLKSFIPVMEKILPPLNTLLDLFTKLPVGLQAATLAFIALPTPIIAVAGAIKGLTASILSLGAAGASPGLARLGALFGGTAGGLLAGAALGLGVNEANNRIAGFNAQFESQLARQRGDVTFLDPAAQKKAEEQKAAITAALEGGALSPELKAAFALGGVAKKKPPPSPLLDLSGLAGGGGGTGGGSLSRAASERAKVIADLIQKIGEARDEFGKGLVEDLEEISKALNAGIIETEKQRQIRDALAADRPAQLAGFAASTAERIRQIELEDAKLVANTAKEAAEALAKLPPILSDSERFMKGFAEATTSVGDAFERFGQNVARAFGNVRDLFNGLKQAVLGFFNDLLGSTLQNLVKSTLGGLFGGGGGGGFGNLFRSFAGGGGGLSAPASVSSGGLLGGLFGGGAARGGSSSAIDQFFGGSVPRTAGSVSSGFSFGALGSSFASAAPLLGLSIGSSLGGQSTFGNILGGIGGALAAFNPLLAAPLLVGAVLLGKAAQRRKDEEASGQFLTQALDAILQLKTGIATDQIEGSAARAIFDSNILGPFKTQIAGLKTRSVRESRLTNQVRDLNNNYNDLILPEIAAQIQRRATAASNALTHSRLIPEFAVGGITRGGLAVLHPQEMVLTREHQSAIRSIAGANVFDRAGVPGVKPDARFDHGGVMPSGAPQEPLVINLAVKVGMAPKDAEQVATVGLLNSPRGRNVIVRLVQDARTNKEL